MLSSVWLFEFRWCRFLLMFSRQTMDGLLRASLAWYVVICGLLFVVVVCCGVVWCVVVCCGVLWCVVVCCGVLWCVVLCCAVLCFVVHYCGSW